MTFIWLKFCIINWWNETILIKASNIYTTRIDSIKCIKTTKLLNLLNECWYKIYVFSYSKFCIFTIPVNSRFDITVLISKSSANSIMMKPKERTKFKAIAKALYIFWCTICRFHWITLSWFLKSISINDH